MLASRTLRSLHRWRTQRDDGIGLAPTKLSSRPLHHRTTLPKDCVHRVPRPRQAVVGRVESRTLFSLHLPPDRPLEQWILCLLATTTISTIYYSSNTWPCTFPHLPTVIHTSIADRSPSTSLASLSRFLSPETFHKACSSYFTYERYE